MTELRAQEVGMFVAPAQLQWLTPVVARLSQQHAMPTGAVWELAEAIDATFANARVQAFVRLLVEKQLRETLRIRDRTPERRL